MQLQLKPSLKNKASLGAILIKGEAPSRWIHEIQAMGLSLETTEAYPLPGLLANTVWGCILLCDINQHSIDIRSNTFCQALGNLLFIPEKTELTVQATTEELQQLLSSQKHLLHPEIGLVLLDTPLQWQSLLEAPILRAVSSQEPIASVFIPKKIYSFQIKPLPPEEILQELEDQAFPKSEKPKDKPLNLFEKAKLMFYEKAFKKASGKTDDTTTQPSPLMGMIASIANLFGKRAQNWTQNMALDYEELEKRNQKTIDRLLDMLKNNPDEALKYAIPLDEGGTGRGGDKGLLDLSMRWGDFSLYGRNQNSGVGGSIMPQDHFYKLQQQYQQTAQELIKQGEHKKAAFVYMKLLKNPMAAAQTLENAHYYPEAASIYLKYANNKLKAAECYEKGNITIEAITLYQELNMHEKVGDLYISIHKKKEAFTAYETVVNQLINNTQYLKASQVYRHKMQNEEAAQHLLKKGWEENKDAYNCLDNYFSNIDDLKALRKEIDDIYQTGTYSNNRETFLQVIKKQHVKTPELSEQIRGIAYEIIAVQIQNNPDIVSELRAFNPDDTMLHKDTMRFKLRRK